MLQIRLRKLSSDSGGGAVVKPLPVEVTVACPDHLVLADLPVAKGIGAVAAASTVKTVGRRSRRHLGERVHFCVRCDFPIAIYGRLSPCEHAFCLDCARSDSICYLCDERIQKIQTIKMMEGIFICAAPHCLKSFLKRSDFESHIQGSHAHLLQPNAEKEERYDESEVQSAKQPTASDSSVRPPLRPLFSTDSNSQLLQPRELPLQRPMMLPKPPYYGPAPNYSLESQPGLQNHFPQGMMGTLQQDISQFADKQQGILSETTMPENLPMNAIRPPNFVVPMNSNPSLIPQYGIPPPFQPEAGQQFYNAPYDMGQTPRTDSAQEAGGEQGSLLGLAPGPAGGMNFMGNYPQPWHAGPSSGGQGTGDGFVNGSDSQGNSTFYQGDYGRNSGVLPMMATPTSIVNKGMEGMQGTNNAMDPRDGPGIVAPQPFPHAPPPPPLLPHSSHGKFGKYYSGGMGRDGHDFGWQQEKQDGFGSGQD